MNHCSWKVAQRRNESWQQKVTMRSNKSPKNINSGFGWFLLDILWWLVMSMMLVVLVLAMTSWLIVGPWRLLNYIIRLFKK